MTVDEIYNKIYANNKHQKERDEKLILAEEKLQKVWDLLPSPNDIPTLPELMRMLSNLRNVRNSTK